MSTRFREIARDVVQKAKPESTLAWVLVAVVLVLVLAGGGIGIWLIVRQSKRTQTKKKIAKAAVAPSALPVVPVVPALTKAKCDPDDPKKWEYVRRLQASNGEWLCPAGWIDTGCNWVDGAETGEKQCKAPRRTPLVAPTPPPPPPPAASASTQWALQQLQQFRDQLQAQQAQQAQQQPQQPRIVVISAGGAQDTAVVSPPTGPPASTPLPTQAPQAQSPYVWRGKPPRKPPSTAKSKCNPDDPAKFEYVRRVSVNGTWVCPPGTVDTGCSWSDGANGEKQCKRIKGVEASAARASAATGVGTGTWMRASATWYTSHPKCCKGASNYDPKANKDECDKYSGCKWAGQFAGVDKKLSIAEVAARNIVAFYDAKNQKGDKKAAEAWWNENVKGKKIELKKPDGTTMIVEALDTCSDSDTQGGECTINANKNNGGGILIDLEESTAKRFYPGGKIKDNSSIEWRWVK